MAFAKRGEKNPAKRPEVGAKISAALRGRFGGPQSPIFKGEWFVTRDGVTRAFVWLPESLRDRLGLKRSFVARARYNWLMAHPKETLTRRDIVHHLNGDALDDRPENLQKLENQSRHAKKHEVYLINAAKARKQPPKNCEQCGILIKPWRRFCSQACFKIFNHGPNHPSYGVRPPDYVLAAAREASRANKWTDEHRERMRQIHLARWASSPRRARTEQTICPFCGTEFERFADVKQPKQFCSKTCANRTKLAAINHG